ncbi:MAG: DUF3794 domain-containing protein [Eubacterium sp.]|nr:DUF3794 domain-containing protein [Eubacterium sp.]
MELCKEYKSISFNEACQTVKESFELDFQENLPQYLDDIEKIVKCSVKATVTDYDYQGNSINLYGKVIISITYKSSESGLLSNIFEEDFSKSFDVDNVENFSFAKVCINTKYSNFHLINQRRFDIHTSLAVRFNIYYQKSTDCLSNCKNAMFKEYSQDYLVCKNSGISSVEFEENMSIADSTAQIKNIINCFTNCSVDEYKIIKDKMLVKGTLSASVIYECINGNIEKLSHNFTYSKIIEASSLDENDKAFVSARLSGLYVKARADENNALSIVEIVGKLVINYQIYKIDTISLNIDSYVPKYNCKLKKSNTIINESPAYFYDDKTLELNFDSDISLVEIIDLKAEILNHQIINSKLTVEVGISFLFYDDKGNICYYEKSQTKEILLSDSEFSGVSGCTMKSFDYVIKSAGALMLRANIEYSAYLYKESKVSFLTDIDIDDEVNNINTPQLTLYFANSQEEIWDIAKKFSTSEELIIDENSLNSNVIDGKRILLIPGM